MSEFNNLFLNYLKDMFKEQIDKEVENWLKDNMDSFGYFVIKGTTRIVKSEFRFVKIKDSLNDSIIFDLVIDVVPHAAISYDEGLFIEKDLNTHLWLTCSFSANIIKNNLEFITLKHITKYEKNKWSKHLICGDLTPRIHSIKDYEKLAEDFIRKNFDKDYDGSEVIPILELIRGLKLDAYDYEFAGNRKPYGRIFFEDGECLVKDKDTGEIITSFVPKNTICVDVKKNDEKSRHSKNITLAHELSHYILHRKAFYFQKLLNEDLVEFECSHYNGLNAKGFDSDLLKKMEIQASILGPILLMPRKALKAYVERSISFYTHYGDNPVLNYVNAIIEEVAAEFKVTVYSARRRLFDIGFFDKVEAKIYLDDAYIKPFAFKKGSLANDETFVLSNKQLKELLPNKEVSEYLASGMFIYVEKHLCINNPKYVTTNSKGELRLTELARNRADRYCLKFKLVSNENNNKELTILNSLFRDDKKCLTYNAVASTVPEMVAKKLNTEKRINYINNVREVKKELLRMEFPEALKYLASYQNISQQALADDIGVSRKTIERYVSGETHPDKKTLIRICIALKLNSEFALTLLKKGKHPLDPDSNDEDAYTKMIFDYCSGQSLKNVILWLSSFGVEGLID